MNETWIHVMNKQYSFAGDYLYINKNGESAKLIKSACTYWGYHDESEWDKEEYIISVEEAIDWVYPNEKAISIIQEYSKTDYSEYLKTLAEKEIEVLSKKIQSIVIKDEIETLKVRISKLSVKMSKTGIFQRYKKKLLQAEIETLSCSKLEKELELQEKEKKISSIEVEYQEEIYEMKSMNQKLEDAKKRYAKYASSYMQNT